MDTNWLEDFISLVDTRSFSRSAQLRHVTQPAFSRRIQALEAWAGSDLFDRTAHPTRLTAAGETLYTQALEMLRSLQTTRAMLRGHSSTSRTSIDFAISHSLAFTFFPGWLTGLRRELGAIKSRIFALNAHDALMRLVEGNCDMLIAYAHPAFPFQIDRDRYETVTLGHEKVSPWSRPGPDGRPLHALPAHAGYPLPYLGYAPGAYLGRLVDLLIMQSTVPLHLDRVYEMDMAEGLKTMAVEGHGVAFLPGSIVRNEVAAGRLVSAVPPDLPEVAITVEVIACREKTPAAADANSAAAQLWKFLNA